MKKVKEQSKIWLESFLEEYKKQLPFIIEAFVTYYGEETRVEINEKIKRIEFLFLLSYTAYINAKKIPDDAFSRMLINYFKYMERVLKIKERQGHKDIEIVHKQIEMSALTNYLYGCDEYEALMDSVTNSFIGTTWFRDYKMPPILVLGIYFVNDDILFHEMNHVITTPTDEISLFPNAVVDELINELIAQDIVKIFHNLIGKTMLPKLEMTKSYHNNFFLIREFYETFKDLIKESIKKKDRKILEENLGEKNLNTYFALVEKLFFTKVIFEEDLMSLKLLVNMMKIYYENKQKEYKRTRNI